MVKDSKNYLTVEIKGEKYKTPDAIGLAYQTNEPILVFLKKEFVDPRFSMEDQLLCRLYYSPNGNCQTFSINHFDTLSYNLKMFNKETQIEILTEVLNICRDKKQFIIDLLYEIKYTFEINYYPTYKDMLALVSNIVFFETKYISTNKSSMSFILAVKREEVKGISLQELISRPGRVY